MRKFILLVLLLTVLPALASHIVGGEFELLHISGERYRLNMILYFDLNNGSVGARDASVTAAIYRKSDNHFMDTVTLNLISETPVGYTQPKCSSGEIRTSKMTYSTDIILSANVYNSPGGYYISWQRCCRNYQITNIYSEAPEDTPAAKYAGQTFYLEFPAVVNNGQPFVNSSPHLFPPLNDYACPYHPYYVNFAGVDDDGDSLVYTMVTPLNTTTGDPLPARAPAPYPPIKYRPGFSLTSIINGQPDLRISSNGVLTCTPRFQGLFVFAVRIDQYRNKKKIGESRRDFQMLVVDGCAADDPPVILGKKIKDLTYTYKDNMTLTFDGTESDADRCIKVSVSDPQSLSPADKYTEKITMKVIPLDFVPTFLGNLGVDGATATLTHGSIKEFSVCLDRCPPTASGFFKIGLVALDDACALPETDTLRLQVYIPPITNTDPYFTQPTVSPLIATLHEGDQMTWPFTVLDNDGDSIILNYGGLNFDLKTAGFTVNIFENKKGRIRGELHWDAYCSIYDFTHQTDFNLIFSAVDIDICNRNAPVFAKFDLHVILPGFADVFVKTNLPPPKAPIIIQDVFTRPGERVLFNVTGTQADQDVITLGALGKGFKLTDHEMKFEPLSAAGTVTSPFTWDVNCTNVNVKKDSVLTVWFTALDNTNKCRVPKWDSVQVNIHIRPPLNQTPALSLRSLNDVVLRDNSITITLGQPISIGVDGVDNDPPISAALDLSLARTKGDPLPFGYVFPGGSAVQKIESDFTWNPDCRIFKANSSSSDFEFHFLLNNPVCSNDKSDTVTLHVTVNDVVHDVTKFFPPNVITPNGDGCNEYFGVEGLDDDEVAVVNCDRRDADSRVSFPLDNCAARFQFVRIVNRWGKEVYHSTNRKFRWYAAGIDMGEYFYTISFGKVEFKGTVSVRP